MAIKGYKAFNNQFQNRYGKIFIFGQKYDCLGDAKFGINGNGYHFCQRLEDTLRYVDGMNNHIIIAEVIGSGNVVEYFDEYYGYYDMYAATTIEIIKDLTREEIIEYILETSEHRIIRFIQGYRLNNEEKIFLKKAYANNKTILDAISYYQENNHDVYCKKLIK